MFTHVLTRLNEWTVQQASLDRPAPFFDAVGLVQRINSLAHRVREASGRVIVIQFSGPRGTPYHPDHAGWQLMPELEVESGDLRLRKPASDAFQSTELEAILGPPGENALIVTGCDTEFCIDSTVRSALARDTASRFLKTVAPSPAGPT